MVESKFGEGCGAPFVVGRDATRILWEGRSIDLSKARAPRLISFALIASAARSRSAELSVDVLIASTWPGERIRPNSAAGRVYAALASLRRAGLRGVIERTPRGYRINPGLPIIPNTNGMIRSTSSSCASASRYRA